MTPTLPRSASTAGLSTGVMMPQEEPLQPSRRPAYGTFAARQQRRHSWQPRPCVQEAENFHLMVSAEPWSMYSPR
jgi:adiponectin receptor